MRIAILALTLLLLANPASSKESVYGMSKKTYDAINKVQVMIEEERYDEAIAEVELLQERKMNGYERAHVLNMAGFLYFQLEDNDRAIAAYDLALQQDGTPESQQRSLLNAVSQVCLAVGKYEQAEQYARRLLATETEAPQPVSQVILAQALVGQENYADAVAPLKKALEMLRVS